MQKSKGFSLIELLIVVAIILIIAAIAIPSLLRARIAANEASAVSSLRTLNTAQISYSSSFPTVGFANTLSSLAVSETELRASGIDRGLHHRYSARERRSKKSGYSFTEMRHIGNAELELPVPRRSDHPEPERRALFLHVCRCGDSFWQRVVDDMQLQREPAKSIKRKRRRS